MLLGAFLGLPGGVFALTPECACVLYVRTVHNVPLYGDADTQVPNLRLFEAETGDVLLFRYPQDSHVAYITKTELDGWWVSESNYTRCETGYRFISRSDSHLVGALRA